MKRPESFQIMVLRNLNNYIQKNERYLDFLLMKQTKLKRVKDLNIKSETMQILYKGNALGDWFGGGVLNKRLKSTSKQRTQINQIS